MTRAKIITAIVSFLIAGGVMGGYKLVRDNQANVYENSIHPVIEVIDGDTIRIPYYKTEDNIRVRLIGIDSPESGECYYKEAKDFLTEFLKKNENEIIIKKDVTGEDSYGRLVRYVFVPSTDPEVDDIFVNQVMVKRGYAIAKQVAPDKTHRDLFTSAQKEAMREKKGLWNVCANEEKINNIINKRQLNEAPLNPNCTIKGNISERGFGKIYFVKGCTGYVQTKIDTRKGESYFCTEKEAKSAGFRKSELCPK